MAENNGNQGVEPKMADQMMMEQSSMDPKTRNLLSDFPKVHCPYVRRLFKVDQEKWKIHGSKLKLKHPRVYLVTRKVNPGFEWVFEDPDTVAVEKLDGTNIKLLTVNGRLEKLQNRLNPIDPLLIMKGKYFILEGVFNAIDKGYLDANSEQAGELIGPKLQGNPYELESHLWYPFQKAVTDLAYRSFLEHERTFENLSSWFKSHLHSRFFTKRASKVGIDKKVFAEGVIFYNARRKKENQSYMAKLRRDMFDWYYSDQIPVFDYTPDGERGTLPSEEMD